LFSFKRSKATPLVADAMFKKFPKVATKVTIS
jgi:hypothetical protein